MSRRYLGLEDWSGLLRKYAQRVGKPYEYYYSSAHGHLPSVATALAIEFQKIYWEDPQYEESRNQHAGNLIDPSSALKVDISEYLTGLTLQDPSEEYDAELESLKQVQIDGVITTNWDVLLEQIFDEFQVYVGQTELLFSTVQSVGEIYKIHGSTQSPNSIILTKHDYDGFEAKNPYLAAKLLTVFVEHPVIFLGYSLADENIQGIIRAIASCLDGDKVEKLRDRLIFTEWVPGLTEPMFESGFYQIGDTQIPIRKLRLDSFLPLYEVLSASRRKFPARLLRQLKQHVYELVQSQDPEQRMYVQDLDEDADLSRLEVVFGVGILDKLGQQGYTSVERLDIFEDVIRDNKNYDAKQVVEHVLPNLVKGNAQVPVFKYLRKVGALDADGNVLDLAVDEDIRARVRKASENCRLQKGHVMRSLKQDIIENDFGLAQIEEKYGPERVLEGFQCLSDDKLVKEDLRSFLDRHFSLASAESSLVRSRFAKLVCSLDCLEYMKE